MDRYRTKYRKPHLSDGKSGTFSGVYEFIIYEPGLFMRVYLEYLQREYCQVTAAHCCATVP